MDLGISTINDSLNFGVVTSCGTEATPKEDLKIEKITAMSLIKTFKSAVTFDISKTSTGLGVWDGVEYKKYKITMDTVYNKTDALSEARMRREFKEYLTELLGGKHFELVVVENVFGGENFDTVRILLALNTVADELILEGVFTADTVRKVDNQSWKMCLRKVHKVKGKPTDKYEIEEIMKYLEFDFALENCNLTDSQKDEIGYQDILDCTGLLCAMAISKTMDVKIKSGKSIKMASIEILNFDCEEDLDFCDEKVLRRYPIERVQLTGSVEKTILNTVNDRPTEDIIFELEVPNERLGTFVSRYNIPFSDYGSVLLIFFRKALKRK